MDDHDAALVDRPHPRLLIYYMLSSLLLGPLFFVVFPTLFFRYHTLRYSFTPQGVHAKWGLIFRREVNLAYRRIQDIHLKSNILQRWLGLADVMVQTASGSAEPELVVEGFQNFEDIRDYLYTKMRGAKDEPKPTAQSMPTATGAAECAAELRSARMALERIAACLDAKLVGK